MADAEFARRVPDACHDSKIQLTKHHIEDQLTAEIGRGRDGSLKHYTPNLQ